MIEDALRRRGEPKAAELAEAVLLSLCEYCGGGAIYLPRAIRYKARRQAIRICAEFTGGNLRALALKYRLTEARIRQIVNGNGSADRGSASP